MWWLWFASPQRAQKPFERYAHQTPGPRVVVVVVVVHRGPLLLSFIGEGEVRVHQKKHDECEFGVCFFCILAHSLCPRCGAMIFFAIFVFVEKRARAAGSALIFPFGFCYRSFFLIMLFGCVRVCVLEYFFSRLKQRYGSVCVCVCDVLGFRA